MNKPATTSSKARKTSNDPAKRRPRKPSVRKTVVAAPIHSLKEKLLFLIIESLSLVIISVLAIIFVIGNTATWISGTSLLGSVVPFTVGVMALILLSSIFFVAWWQFRGLLKAHSAALIPVSALGLLLGVIMLVDQDQLSRSVSQFRTLVIGKEEASLVTLNHQVFAAYRRYEPENLEKMIVRSNIYNAVISEAATEYDVDQNVLQGIAAAETSFNPRDSKDGGHGLFQITAVPKSVLEEAKSRLNTSQLSLSDHRHNAFIAAATFKHYLAEMKNDMFLGLLAYNIGPSNGGLRFIMDKYGVTDFVTIQPYLQLLPRDYPIRVLSYALAFRLWEQQGRLPAYEAGRNAMKIQKIGVPGLS